MKTATRVVNMRRKYNPEQQWEVVVARPSKWGNPYRIGVDGMLDEVLAKYRAHVLAHPDLLAALPELQGKVLACWCAPQRGLTAADRPHICHGQILAELADATEPT